MIDFRKTVLGDLVKNVGKIQNQREEILMTILRKPETRNFIIKLQEEQLRFGIRGDGTDFPASNPNYVESVRRREGSQQKPTFKINLLNKGRFYDTIDVVYGKSFFEIIANLNLYGKNFQDLYGNGSPILGLTDNSINQLIEFIEDDFILEVARRLWL